MELSLPSSEKQLKLESHLYLIKGVMWASLVSVFIMLAIFANIAMQVKPIISVTTAILYMLPTLSIAVIGAVKIKIRSVSAIPNKLLLFYLFILQVSWLLLTWRIFDNTDTLVGGDEALASIETLIDILVLTFAIALFPNPRVMWVGVLPLMLMGLFLRITEIPDNYIFPMTKFTCFFAIIITGQKVLFSWFKKAIVRDVEKQYLLKHFRRMALIDGLTQISNRRHFDEILSQEVRASERNSHPLCVILIDVDYFKKLNDSLGHQVGDECLVKLAQVLSSIANRPRDLAARYGGEEFVILLPDTDLKGSLIIAEKLKQAITEIKLPHPDSDVSQWVTVSQGVCQWQDGLNMDSLMSSADNLLYQAKSEGRDRYVAGCGKAQN